ncbi:hypothetical protein HPP92_002817 [Vanilla planifolia]|uniref:Tubby-like F-box protein n=1 Tax=Vanilla planifolia TaxID=51239 RepID=A0A835S1W0_VANPL|nr:hypothetical protein HPP92_002817 [Vanilla planifolia]
MGWSPSELLSDVIKRLEAAKVHGLPKTCCCMCSSLQIMEPGPRDGTIQCFIKRDKSKMTYHLYLCLNPAVLVENGKFLLSAKRSRRTTLTEYVISMDADHISRSSKTYIGKLRSNFLGTKFLIYDTRPTNHTADSISPPPRTSRNFYAKKVSPKVPTEATPSPRYPTSSMYSAPEAPSNAVHDALHSRLGSRTRISFSRSSLTDRSMDFSSARFSDLSGDYRTEEFREPPLVLRNKAPRWHDQLQCWCLNFRGRVTIASVKNFQLVAQSDQDKVILQFGKVAKDTFTMDYRYPLSAFQAFAICLSSFDTKLACE